MGDNNEGGVDSGNQEGGIWSDFLGMGSERSTLKTVSLDEDPFSLQSNLDASTLAASSLYTTGQATHPEPVVAPDDVSLVEHVLHTPAESALRNLPPAPAPVDAPDDNGTAAKVPLVSGTPTSLASIEDAQDDTAVRVQPKMPAATSVPQSPDLANAAVHQRNQVEKKDNIWATGDDIETEEERQYQDGIREERERLDQARELADRLKAEFNKHKAQFDRMFPAEAVKLATHSPRKTRSSSAVEQKNEKSEELSLQEQYELVKRRANEQEERAGYFQGMLDGMKELVDEKKEFDKRSAATEEKKEPNKRKREADTTNIDRRTRQRTASGSHATGHDHNTRFAAKEERLSRTRITRSMAREMEEAKRGRGW